MFHSIYSRARDSKQKYVVSGEEEQVFYVNLINGGLGNQISSILSGLCYGQSIGIKNVSVLCLSSSKNNHSSQNCESVAFFPKLKVSYSVNTPYVIHNRTIFETKPRTIQKNASIIFQSDVGHLDYDDRLENIIKTYVSLQNFDESLKGAVFMHVRRGDYIKFPYKYLFGLDLEDYYKKALKTYDLDRCVVFVCSDDIQWCKKNLPLRYPEVRNWRFSTCKSATEEILCMASCTLGGILANSSLSWCGAMFGKFLSSDGSERKYTAPSHFFRHSWPINPTKPKHAPWMNVIEIDINRDYNVAFLFFIFITAIFLGVYSLKKVTKKLLHIR